MTIETSAETGTDITTRDQRAELAKLDAAFVEAFPALDPTVDIRGLLEQTMGTGGSIQLSHLTRIKVPPGELRQWMVPDDNGDQTPAKTITGIPVAVLPRRSWWPTPEPSGAPPDCRSNDLTHGVGTFGPGSEQNPTGTCDTCPMAKKGSANKGTNASACSEQRVMFLLQDDLLPVMVVIPPGSLRNFAHFTVFMFRKRIEGHPRGVDPDTGQKVMSSSWLRLVVELGLERDVNPAGQEYNKATFRIVRRLTDEELVQVDAYGRWVDELIAAQEDALTTTLAGDDATLEANVPFDAAVDGAGLPMDEVPLDAAVRSGKKAAAR